MEQSRRIALVDMVKKKSNSGTEEIGGRLEIIADNGVAGDARCGQQTRQISLFLSDGADPRGDCGFCATRFHANIDVSGLDAAILRVGQKIKIGTALLEIEQIGKKCWPDCPACNPDRPCARNMACLFAHAAENGIVGVGDEVFVR